MFSWGNEGDTIGQLSLGQSQGTLLNPTVCAPSFDKPPTINQTIPGVVKHGLLYPLCLLFPACGLFFSRDQARQGGCMA